MFFNNLNIDSLCKYIHEVMVKLIAAFIMIIIWKFLDMAEVCPLNSH